MFTSCCKRCVVEYATNLRRLQEEHAAMVAQLKADPVLGPLLSYCRCILTHNDVHVYDVCCFGREDGRCPEHS